MKHYKIILLSIILMLVVFASPYAALAISLLTIMLVALWGATRIVALRSPKPKMPQHPQDFNQPFVTIMLACSSESARVVNSSLLSLSQMDYDRYEVLVIHNNNQNEEEWRQIEQYCQRLGSKFKFFHEDRIEGFKAGALNYLQQRISPESEIISVIDADYHVDSDYLSSTVGHFADKKVGLVQLPQDYFLDNSGSRSLYLEFRSFFSLIMNQAQHLNGVVFTGTMGMLRTSLFSQGLTWNEWCITEDAEMGMQVHAMGYRGVYLDQAKGRGVMPLTMESLQKQRRRWSYGNMQIIRKNFTSVLLNPVFSWGQRLSFFTQLVSWFHFEAAMIWLIILLGIVSAIAPSEIINLSISYLTLGLGMALVINFAYFIVGLKRIKGIGLWQRLRVFILHQGLAATMNHSWIDNLLGIEERFQTTDKEKKQNAPVDTPLKVDQEMILLLLGVLAMTIGVITGGIGPIGVTILGSFVMIGAAGRAHLFQQFSSAQRAKRRLPRVSRSMRLAEEIGI